MTYLKLGNTGLKGLISPEDEERVNKYHWYITSGSYIEGTVDRKKILLHRFITNAPKGLVVDHINHNKLDNRKNNLRIVSYQQNAFNTHAKGYTKTKNGFKNYIKYNNRYIHLGQTKSEDEAKENSKLLRMLLSF